MDVKSLEYNQIWNKDATSEYSMTSDPEIKALSIALLGTIPSNWEWIGWVKAGIVDPESMNNSICYPFEHNFVSEAFIVHSDSVKVWVPHE